MPTAWSSACTARPTASWTGELLNASRILPSHPEALASSTSFLAAAGSYFGPEIPGYHLNLGGSRSEVGMPFPLLPRSFRTLGSTAAATAWRMRRSAGTGGVLVGPSGFPVHVGAGLPPEQATVAPVWSNIMSPPYSSVEVP